MHILTAEAQREPRLIELHNHYARNALARGHAEDCALVTEFGNWPNIMGRPACTCPRGRK